MSGEAETFDPDRLFGGFPSLSSLLVAVSGGPDSMALLHLAAVWRDSGAARQVFAATVDHGIRAESAAEAQQVALWAEMLEIPHRILLWSGEKPKTAVQEEARAARYRLLFDHARDIGACATATAHHADDQWETLMIRMARGSGLAGLAGMSREQHLFGGRLIRPLLDLPKADLIGYCQKIGQPFFDDPSNAQRRFDRTRWREVSPTLHELGLTRGRMARLAERAAKAEAALDACACEFFVRIKIPSEDCAFDLSKARETPQAIIEYFLQRALTETVGAPPPRLERLEDLAARLLAALRQGAGFRATLGGGLVSLDRKGRLILRAEDKRKRGRTRKS